ncbi:MAG: serine hydrolase [Nannocystaceae bacterium]|nr:serine hydrolase [Nannocystaceae bacterium]
MTDPRASLFELLEAAVADGVFPGCVAAVWHAGSILYEEAHGKQATHSDCSTFGQGVERGTVYDLASLTKVIATTTLAAQLVSAGRWSLDQPVPSPWASACPGATLADLLEHSSGLAAHREYFTMVEPFDAEKVLHHVMQTQVAYERGTKAVYSDLGFMVLGAWLERELDSPLDLAFADRVAFRLALEGSPLPALAYRRLWSESALKWDLERRIAPTEIYASALHPDGAPSHFDVRSQRAALAHGAVHDDNAYVMGGVAGHAGLFGTAAAVLEVAIAWAEGRVPDVDLATRDRFWKPSTVPGSTRRLGWDGTPGDGSGSTGTSMSADAVGHTGYTGTSVWIDPAAKGGALACVLLTNRVHPVRTNTTIKAFRPRFHEAAAKLR